jgi:hypothetical protein
MPCRGPITKDIGVTTLGRKETSNDNTSTIEAIVSGQEDEKVTRIVHSLETGPCHLD